jgi:hypothetical protein
MIFVLLLTNLGNLPGALADDRIRRDEARHRKSRLPARKPRRRVSRVHVVTQTISYGNGCHSYTIDGRPVFVYGVA